MAEDTDTNERFRRRLQRITEAGILQLKDSQLFQPPEFLSPEHIVHDSIPILDRYTPIGSMGSCFAREIKNYLEAKKYNYVHYGRGKRASHGSASWERVFNTSCIRQEIERALTGISYTSYYAEGTDSRIYDLYRKNTSFQTWSEARTEEKEYIENARLALIKSDVFIITLGLSEVWNDRRSGLTMAEAPPSPVYNCTNHTFKLISPEENIKNLQIAIAQLTKAKPEIKIILTVSPVPLRATFFDRSALISNNVSKSTLLYTAHVITQEYENVSYFPSYEITQYLAKNPFQWDGRHVTESTVNLIMSLFIKTFSK